MSVQGSKTMGYPSVSLERKTLKTPRSKLRGISMQGTFIFIFAHLTLQQAAGNTLAIHLSENLGAKFLLRNNKNPSAVCNKREDDLE